MASTMRINGVTITGNNISMVNGKIIVDAKEWTGEKADGKKVVVEILGQNPNDVLGLDLKGMEVNVYGSVKGNIDCNTGTIQGDVHGSVDATTLSCGSVGGDVDATTVNCGNVSGRVDAVTVNRR